MDSFRTKCPTLCDLLAGTPFEGDATAASAMSTEDMKRALEERGFVLNELMWLLCGVVIPEWANSEATQLESDLASVVAAVGLAPARAAYKDKFLVEARSRVQDPRAKLQDAKNKLEDVRYEIAVAAKACAVFDDCSIQLEKPIRDASKREKDWKNSDVFGTFQGQPVRIEVTVLHESLPPAFHIELDNLVRQAGVASGFRVTLRTVLVDEVYAEWVRALVELLYEQHAATGGTHAEIDGVIFEWKKGAYHCPQDTSPFESICFYAKSECGGAEQTRDIIHPCSVRPVTSTHILEDNPNPPGVVTSADLPDAPTQVPVSTKVRQMVDGKRQQCEEGVINIVALGNPLPMHDREIADSVCGSEYAAVQFWTDKHGVRHAGKGDPQRDPKAPFRPAQHLPSNDDRTQFIAPFQIVSAVWHIRNGQYAKSQIILNPNAAIPIPMLLAKAFSGPAAPSITVGVGQQVDGTTPPTDSQADDSEQEEDIVWYEMAENYVHVCGTVAEAWSVLAKLEQSGLSLERVREMVNQLWSGPSKDETKSKWGSPTNEEMAMTFVVDCGDYEQAKAFLDAYAKEKK